MSTVQLQPVAREVTATAVPVELKIYSHSALFYWWPVWLLGFVLAAITYIEGELFQFQDAEVIIHPSKNLGVMFTVVCFLVILMTHTTVRGIASLTVIVTMLAVTFLFAYLQWWNNIFQAIDAVAIYMNLGFYVFFSTAIFVIWLLGFFIFDRFDYWIFRPGQLVHYTVLGGGEQTYDTHGMSVFKLRDDLFRHWVLGLGSGDLHIATTGARKSEFVVPNVLFISRKLARVQHLVAMSPDETPDAAATAGQPG